VLYSSISISISIASASTIFPVSDAKSVVI
jgi:hypothetical protein